MKKLILIDGNALVHRAFHALPPLKAPNGMVANAVFGFASILIKTIKELKPDYMAAAFDLAGPTFRHEEYKEYKAHREKAPDELYAQMPVVKKLLGAFGVPIYEKEGFEADDLIGTLAKKAVKESVQTIILTGDLDALQLVEDKKIMVYTPKKGVSDTVLYDEDAVKERYGGLLPSQLIDYKGLRGDPSDNIPGVLGVGEKTAVILIKKFGSIEKMYEELENKSKLSGELSEKLRQKLLENKEKAFLSKKLSAIITDMPVDFSVSKAGWLKNFKSDEVESVFKELAFSSLIKRLSELSSVKQDGFTFQEAPKTGEKKIAVKKIKSGKEAAALLGGKKSVAITFQEGLLYFSFDSSSVYETEFDMAVQILKEGDIEKIAHDSKSIFKESMKRGIRSANIFDTSIAAYLINPDQKDYSFEKVYFQEFQSSSPTEAKYRPAYLLELKNRLWEKMKEQKLIKVFEEIESPLIHILAEMEDNGIKVDVKSIEKLAEATSKELEALEKKIYEYAGTEFNINSPQQLGEILFEKLKLKGRVRKTGRGARSTAAPELEKLIEEHPVVEPILQYREFQKLKTTYIDPFPALVAEDGRIHTTFNQTGTGTGRLASENPNLQNIPIKTELGQKFRKAFVAEKGYKLVSLDYSQLELRIAAHVAGDKKMIEAFKRGEDIHTRTAAEIFEVRPQDVTKRMRDQAKVINFGIIYGMGILGFARAVGTDKNKAKEFIYRYLGEFSGVAKYIEDTKNKVRETGYVETIFGRRRYIPEVFSSMPDVMRQGDRMAVNAPIQGTEADMLKIAMTKIDSLVHENYEGNDVKMLIQVHDELLFEVKEKLTNEFSREAKKIMEDVADLSVPLTVDVKVGNNWAEMEPIKL